MTSARTTPRPPARRPPLVAVLVLAIVAVAAAGFAHSLARTGLITSPDSLVYEGTAANLHAGRGFTVPFTTVAVDVAPADARAVAGRVPLVQFPPLFPAALAAGEAFGLSPADAARALNPTLLGVDVFLVGLLVVAVVGARRWWWSLPVLAVLLCGLPRFERSPMLLLYGSVLSEPLLITFVLAGLLALEAAVRRRSTGWFIAATVLAGAASATRFVGVALAVAVAVAVLLWAPAQRAARIGWSALAGVAAVAPTVAFVLVGQARLHGHGHPLTFGSVGDAAEQLGSGFTRWLVPTSAGTPARLAVLLGAAVVVIATVAAQAHVFQERGDAPDARAARRLVAVLAVAYLAVVVASRLTFDQNVALWGRHLELLWILVLVLFAGLLANVTLGREARAALLVGTLLVGGAVAGPGASDLRRIHRIGYVPGRTALVPAAERRALRAVPADVLIFTNAPDALYDDTGRPSFMVPCRNDYYTHDANHRFDDDRSELLGLVRAGEAVLVLTTAAPVGSPSCLTASDLRGTRLARAARWPGGALYQAP